MQLETEPIDAALPVDVAAERVSMDIRLGARVAAASTEGYPGSRTLTARASIRSRGAAAAVDHLVVLTARSFERHSLGPFWVRRLSAVPRPHANHADPGPPAVAAPNASSPVLPGPANAPEPIKIWAATGEVIRDLRDLGHHESAAAVELCLRPGHATTEALHALRGELVRLRSDPGFPTRTQHRMNALLLAVTGALRRLGSSAA